MKETNFMHLVQIRARERGYTMFRNNVGTGWVGKAVHFSQKTKVLIYPGDVVVRKARPLHAGLCVGSSDLVGWQNGTGLFTAFETKTEYSALTPEQGAFLNAANLSGGIGKCIRDLKEIP